MFFDDESDHSSYEHYWTSNEKPEKYLGLCKSGTHDFMISFI